MSLLAHAFARKGRGATRRAWTKRFFAFQRQSAYCHSSWACMGCTQETPERATNPATTPRSCIDGVKAMLTVKGVSSRAEWNACLMGTWINLLTQELVGAVELDSSPCRSYGVQKVCDFEI